MHCASQLGERKTPECCVSTAVPGSCSLPVIYPCFLPAVYVPLLLLVVHPSQFQNQEEEPEGNFPDGSKKDNQVINLWCWTETRLRKEKLSMRHQPWVWWDSATKLCMCEPFGVIAVIAKLKNFSRQSFFFLVCKILLFRRKRPYLANDCKVSKSICYK